MDSKTLTFLGLISGPRQYRIPPFQRAYSWEREERETLWLDMLNQYERLHALWALPDEDREEELQRIPSHYLGTIVLSGPSALGVPRSDVIDGQQRITTLMLALSALRDAWGKSLAKTGTTDEAAAKREHLSDTYLRNPGKDGLEKHRAIPLTIDKKAFEAVVNFEGKGVLRSEDLGLGDGDSQRVLQAYKFFLTEMRRRVVNKQANPQLERFAGLFPLDFAILEQVIAHRLSVIAIETKSLDDTNAIFESLNAKGKPLSQLDLLRNYIFMLLRGKAADVLHAYWEPMETIHLRPSEVQLLVWADVVSRGTNVLQKRTYRTVQAQLREQGATSAVAEGYVKELHRKASYFKRILRPAEEPNEPMRTALARLNEVGGRTARPLILWLYEQVNSSRCDISEATECVRLVESYLVRRFLAGLAPNNLNSQFGTMLARLNSERLYDDNDGPVVERLKAVMLLAPREWPDGDAVREGVLREDFYHNGDTSQRLLIMRTLDQSFGYQLQPSYVESDKSIEHVMPQSRSAEWRADLKELGEELSAVQDRFLHTLGNLTIVPPDINSVLGNKPFSHKRAVYADVEYKMTKAIAAADDSGSQIAHWGSKAITERAEDLARRAMLSWPRPTTPQVTADETQEDAFDDELDDSSVQFTSSIDEEASEEFA